MLPLCLRRPRSGVQNCATDNEIMMFDMDFNRKAERNAKIYARRVDGLTLPAISREFNLARETVREIIRCMQRKALWREYDAKLRAKDN
jgi:hypothetical protein